jgi:hypothetical protein
MGGCISLAILSRPSLLTDAARTEEGVVRIGEDVVRYTVFKEEIGAVTCNMCGPAGDKFVNKAICCSY